MRTAALISILIASLAANPIVRRAKQSAVLLGNEGDLLGVPCVLDILCNDRAVAPRRGGKRNDGIEADVQVENIEAEAELLDDEKLAEVEVEEDGQEIVDVAIKTQSEDEEDMEEQEEEEEQQEEEMEEEQEEEEEEYPPVYSKKGRYHKMPYGGRGRYGRHGHYGGRGPRY